MAQATYTQAWRQEEITLTNGETVPSNSLRALTLPFGKFKGLALAEVVDLERGQWALQQDGRYDLGAGKDGLIKAISDDDGIRYLDWLLGEGAKKHGGWLYNNTWDAIAQFMRHPRNQDRLARALAPTINGEKMILDGSKVPAPEVNPLVIAVGERRASFHMPFEGMTVYCYWTDELRWVVTQAGVERHAKPATYDACDIQDIRPSGFTVDETFDRSKWRNHGSPVWINTKPIQEDKDPSPWELRGYELNQESEDLDESDGWQPSVSEEPPLNWTPPVEKPLTNWLVWQEGMDFISQLESIGDANTREIEDTPDREFQDIVVPGAKSKLQTLVVQIKTRLGNQGSWLPIVPAQLQKAITEAVADAKERIRFIESGDEAISVRAELLEEAMRELEMLPEENQLAAA